MNKYKKKFFNTKKRVLYISYMALIIGVVCGIFFIKSVIKGKAQYIQDEKNVKYANEEADSYEFRNIKCTVFDYYSDSQVNSSATPGEITDGICFPENGFTRFTRALLDSKKYADPVDSPAKYPLYIGQFAYGCFGGENVDFVKMAFKTYDGEAEDFETNYWLSANTSSTNDTRTVTMGLVDTYLDDNGNIMQSNENTGKSGILPLFDKTFLSTTKHRNSELPLANVKEGVNFPLLVNNIDGVDYYSFNSAEDTVRFNGESNFVYQGKNTNSVLDKSGKKAFMPFNSPEDSNSEKLNFGFGLKMEYEFYMTDIGKFRGQDMIFEFKGDDDLWVFIDGILALDIGGTHGIVGGKINFATLSSTVDKVKNNDIAFSDPRFTIIEDREYTVEEMTNMGIIGKLSPEKGILYNVETPFPQDLKDKLSNIDVPHQLTIFYIERGMVQSNLCINMNLPSAKTDNKLGVVVTNGEECKEVKNE